ncbi:MAG: hypothetical protein WED09_07165 [Homoserinimonas sp.]
MILNKYLAALLSIGIVVLTAFIAIPEADRTPATIGQLVILALGAIVTYLVPLLESRWAGLFKTGSAVVAAVIAAAIPFLTAGGITAVQVAVVALAALNALAVEVGVQVRKDDLRLAA